MLLAPPSLDSSITLTTKPALAPSSTWMITGMSSLVVRRRTIARTPFTPISLPPYTTCPLVVTAMRMLFLSSCIAEAASGFSTSTPVSSTNTVVTMKKISRMNTMSISGEMLMSMASSAPMMDRRPLTMPPPFV